MDDQRVRILLLDGRSDSHKSLENKLRRFSKLDVMTASSAVDCLRKVQQAKGNFDVVLVNERSHLRARELNSMKSIQVSYPHINTIITNQNGNGHQITKRLHSHRTLSVVNDENVLPLIDLVVERKRLKAQLKQRERERNLFQGLFKVSRSITHKLVPEKVAKEVYQHLRQFIPGIDSFYIATYSGKQDGLQFVLMADRGKVIKNYRPTRSIKEDCGLARKVVKARRPLIIDDIHNYPGRKYISSFSVGSPTRTYIGLPLVNGNKLIGVISVQSYMPHAFDEDQKKFIQTVANYTAVAMESALLQQQQSQRVLVLSKLYETIGAIRATPHVDEDAHGRHKVLSIIVSHLQELFKLDTCTIGLINHDRSEIRIVAQRGLGRRVTRPLKGLPKAIVRKAFNFGDPIEIPDLAQVPALKRALVRQDLQSFVILPLFGRRGLQGVITMGRKERISLSSEQKDLLRALTDQAAIAIENADQHEQIKSWARQLETLGKMTFDMANQSDPRQLMHAVIRRAATLLNSPGGGLYLLKGDELVLEARRKLPAELELSHFTPNKSVVGRVLQTKKPFSVADYRHWPHRRKEFDKLNLTAVVGAPMMYRGRPLGVIVVNDTKKGRAYTQDEVRLLQHFAGRAGAAIQMAQNALKERAELIEEEEIISGVTNDLTSELDYRKLIRKVANVIRERLGYQFSTLFLSSEATNVRSVFLPEYRSGVPNITLLKKGKGVVGHVAKTGKPYIASDVENEPGYIPGLGHGSEIALPVTIGKELIGVLDIESTKTNAFSERDERLLRKVANVMAIAIDNARKTSRLEETTSLNEMIVKSRNLDEVSQIIARKMLKACPSTFCHVTVRTRDTQPFLRVRAAQAVQRSKKLEWNPHRGKLCRLLTEPTLARLLQQKFILFKRKKGEGYRFIRAFERHISLKGKLNSVLVIPLRGASNRTIGLCILGEMRQPERHSFTSSNIRFCTTLALHAAVAVEKQSGQALTEELAAQMESLHDIGIAMSSTLDQKKLLKKIVTSGRKLLKAEVCSIFLVRRGGHLTLETSSGSSLDVARKKVEFEIKRNDGLTGHIAKVGRLFNKYGEELVNHPAVKRPGRQPHLPSGYCHAMLAVPLRRRKGGRAELIGLIKVENKMETANKVAPERGFGAADVILLKTLASYAEATLENILLYDFATSSKKVAEEVSATLEMDQVLERILKLLKKLIPLKTASIQLLDGGELKVVACCGFNKADKKKVLGLRFPLTKDYPNYHVIKYKQSRLIPDVRETRYNQFWDKAEDFCTGNVRSWFGVPLLRGGKAIGMLSIESDKPNCYTHAHREFVNTFAGPAASALQNAQLYRTTQSLLDIVLDLTGKLDLKVLKKLADDIIDKKGIIGADNVVIYLHDPDHDRVEETFVCAGLSTQERKYIDTHSETVRRLIHSKDLRIYKDVPNDPLFRRSFARRMKIKAVIAAPLRISNRSVGVICAHYRNPHLFDQREKELLRVIAQHTAITIQHARKYQTAAERFETAKNAAMNLYAMSAWAHDARKSNSDIIDGLDLLESSLGKLNQDAREYLRYIKQASKDLKDLPAPPDSLDERKAVSLSEILKEVQEKHSPAIQRKQIVVKNGLDDLPLVFANKSLIFEALNHLTQNALVALHSGGRIKVSGHEKDGRIYVRFTDNGRGIPPAVLKVLFKRRVPSGKKGGSGVGLLLSRMYLNACDGDLMLEQTRKGRTTFVLDLPKANYVA